MTKCKQKPSEKPTEWFLLLECDRKRRRERESRSHWVRRSKKTEQNFQMNFFLFPFSFTNLCCDCRSIHISNVWWRWQQSFHWNRQQTQSELFIEITTHIQNRETLCTKFYGEKSAWDRAKKKTDTNRNKLMLSSRSFVSTMNVSVA